jgi:hypothetical protein
MLSSLLRPKRSRRRVEDESIFSTPEGTQTAKRAHATADWTEDELADDLSDDQDEGDDNEGDQDEEDEEDADDQDEEDGHSSPLLPIFSAAHLGLYRSRYMRKIC